LLSDAFTLASKQVRPNRLYELTARLDKFLLPYTTPAS
jgi:hypothetical protein